MWVSFFGVGTPFRGRFKVKLKGKPLAAVGQMVSFAGTRNKRHSCYNQNPFIRIRLASHEKGKHKLGSVPDMYAGEGGMPSVGLCPFSTCTCIHIYAYIYIYIHMFQAVEPPPLLWGWGGSGVGGWVGGWGWVVR